MKEHDFIDLKMGWIEQYSMVVKKSELDQWKKLGWLTYDEIGFPEEIKQADMLFGEIYQDETLIFNRPDLLKDIQKEQFKGLEIKGFVPYLGTYGMGGPGFFGLLLENDQYLTYAVWHAGTYIIIDNRVVECYQWYYDRTQPWIFDTEQGKQDDLSEHIIGSKIEDFSFTVDSFTLLLKKSDQIIKVEFVKNDPRLPKSIEEDSDAYKEGEISDYIVLQHKDAILIV